MFRQLLILATIILVASAQTTIPFNDVVVLGQSSYTTNTSGLSATNLNHPPSLGIIGNNLVVSDYNNLRVIAYNLENIQNGSPAYVAINAASLDVRGSYSSNGVEPYTENGVEYIWIGAVGTNGNPDSVIRYTLPLTANQAADPVTFPGLSLSTPQAVEVDTVNQLYYVVDTGNNRVLQYSANDLTTPTRIYGQASISGTSPNRGGAPSASTLRNPTKVILGCNNDLWIVDSRNNRILHYSNSNTVADFVIGQTNFVSVGSGSSASKLNVPLAAVANPECTFLWVADTLNNRVLKFNIQTLANGISASEVLGAVGNKGPAVNRFTPTDIDIDTRTQRLWIADFDNNRVLGGVTTNVATPTPSPTSAPSVSSTPSASFSSAPSASSTSAPSASSTPSASSSSAPSVSSTPSVSMSSAPSASSSSAPSASSSSVPSATSSPVPSPSSSPMPSPSACPVPTPSPSCPTPTPNPCGCSSNNEKVRINFYFADLLRGANRD